MVTCDECSRLYHQNCHNPEITSSELRDPRFIFVCMQCKQKRTKATAFKSPGGPATNTQPSGTKETAAAAVRSTKSTEKAISKPQGPSLFKPVVPPAKDRIVTAAASPTTTSPVKQTGIASLAADFLAKRAGKVVLPKPALDALPKAAPVVSTTSVTSVGVGKLASTQSPSSATSSSSLTRPAPPKPIAPSPKSAPTIPPMVGAEKRLQAMKKKAAQGKSMFK
uniref:PHD-type domain-containing protein n=1 Tax=Plectus sambesii TaxID=2011161 RepID=A0A914WSH0_9BILA